MTYTPPSGHSGHSSWSVPDDAASRPTAVVGQVSESARPTAVVGHAPATEAATGYPPTCSPGYPPGPEQAPYGALAGQPPTGAVPYVGPYTGYGTPPPAPSPPKRGWIGWLVGGVAVVLVAGIVAAYLLLSGGGTLIGVSTDQVAIPDASTTGITDGVVLDGSGTVQDVHLEASITHPYTCDLTVVLVSPQGTRATVAAPQDCSRSAPNLAIDLDSSTPGSPLAPFAGEEAEGEWRLEVVDAVAVDQGALAGWGLTVQTG